MDTDPKDILKNQLNSLPDVIKNTILNSNWQEKIRRVVKTNNLHVDQGASIENLVFITMLGIETPENFVQNAKEYARVSEEQAYNISAEVEREIFGDIRKKLIEITDISGTVAEVDQATNQLSKVAEAIEKEASTTKTPLKEKIPANYFEKNEEEIRIQEDPYKETLIEEKPEEVIDIVEEVAPEPVVVKRAELPTPIEIEAVAEPEVPSKIPPKPIFNPMPKEISPQNSETKLKMDPYREPIE